MEAIAKWVASECSYTLPWQGTYVCVSVCVFHLQYNCLFGTQDEKEQLLQYSSTVAGLVGRAKNIVQLTPRHPDSPLRSSIPVKAVCDYRQIEVRTLPRIMVYLSCLKGKPATDFSL